jgi:hypothetical protein
MAAAAAGAGNGVLEARAAPHARGILQCYPALAPSLHRAVLHC